MGPDSVVVENGLKDAIEGLTRGIKRMGLEGGINYVFNPIKTILYSTVRSRVLKVPILFYPYHLPRYIIPSFFTFEFILVYL